MAQPGPNPQTNLIISIVAPVVALIAIAVMFFTKPVVVVPTPPTPVNTSAAKLPDAGVVPANALPGAGNSGSAGGASQAGRTGGSPFGPGGPGAGAPGVPGGGARSGKPMGNRAGSNSK